MAQMMKKTSQSALKVARSLSPARMPSLPPPSVPYPILHPLASRVLSSCVQPRRFGALRRGPATPRTAHARHRGKPHRRLWIRLLLLLLLLLGWWWRRRQVGGDPGGGGGGGGRAGEMPWRSGDELRAALGGESGFTCAHMTVHKWCTSGSQVVTGSSQVVFLCESHGARVRDIGNFR